MVGEEEVVALYNPITMAELKLVLFHCNKEKSPRPNGWSTDFFIYFFDLVGEDLLQMVEESRLSRQNRWCLKLYFFYIDTESQ
jgi:hypothetical protein